MSWRNSENCYSHSGHAGVFRERHCRERGLYRVGATPPVLQQFVAPAYPKEAAAAHHGGTVVLWVVVEADGSVSEARVQQPAGEGLDEVAASAVRKWSFLPALKDGKPVAVQIWIPLSFDGKSLEISATLERLSS